MENEAQEAAAHAAGGMPQLDVTTWSNQIFWLLVALVVIYFVLSRVALPRIEAVLAKRSGTMTNDLAAAEELKRKAVAAENAYEEALAKARSDAAKIVADTKADIAAGLVKATAEADVKIAAQVAGSEARIAEIRAGALENVTEVAKETAAAVVALLGGQVQPDEIASAVSAQLKG